MLAAPDLLGDVRMTIATMTAELRHELAQSADGRVSLSIAVPGANVSAELEDEHARRAVVAAAALPAALEALHLLTGARYALVFPAYNAAGETRWLLERLPAPVGGEVS